MTDRGRTPKSFARPALLAVVGLWAFAACGDIVTQIDPSDIVELFLSADSAQVGVGRVFDLDAYPLDDDGTLLVGQAVAWTSTNELVATVDGDGLVTGVSTGTATVVAQIAGLSDSTFITVVAPPVLVLSDDSVGFVATAGGADPAPDTIAVTNGGVLALVVTVDSIVPVSGAAGWLTAQLVGSVAPANLVLTAAASGITAAGTSTALVWLSGVDADDSPAAVQVTLRITAGGPASVTLNDGNNQTRAVGSAVTIAPSVRVEDAFGNPAAGATVNFAVTGGSGSLAGASPTVDASGIARVGSWTLGTTAGANQLTATLGIFAPVVFSATGTPGAPTQVVVTGGNNQSAVSGNAVAVAPSVAVRDQFDNGVTGVAVVFAVTGGGGGVTGASPTTGPAGVATVGSWTLGPQAGANTLRATAAGVPDTAFIAATGLSGLADSMFVQAGNTQADTVAATLPVPYSVKVVDANGNGVQGIPVSWAVTGGGGSFQNTTSTDVNGVATARRVLGIAPGTHTATAAVGGLAGSPVQFSATAAVGSPAAITVTAGAAQSDTVNQFLPVAPQVRVADKFDNPIQGNLVTFQVTGGGGVVSPTTAIATQANGTATVTSWRLGTAAGPSNNTLSATGTGAGITGNPITITATAVADAPTSIAIVQGGIPQQTAISGVPVATAPTVVVRDQFNNPVSGRAVSFSPSGNGGVGSPAPATNASGQASTSWAVDGGGHSMATNGTFQNTLTATVQGTAISTSFTGFAIYSWATHVNPMWSPSCTGCHGAASGLALSGTAAVNYDALFNINPVCDATLVAAGWRRVNTSGGDTGHDRSVLRVLMEPTGSDVIGACGPHGGAKVSAANLAILRAWIRNGVPEN